MTHTVPDFSLLLLNSSQPHRLARRREYNRCRRAGMSMEQREEERDRDRLRRERETNEDAQARLAFT